MRKTAELILFVAAISTLSPRSGSAQQTGAAPSWSAVETAFGRKGAVQPGNVIKFSFPRSDLSVTIGGAKLEPALALGGWVAFKAVGGGQSGDGRPRAHRRRSEPGDARAAGRRRATERNSGTSRNGRQRWVARRARRAAALKRRRRCNPFDRSPPLNPYSESIEPDVA